MQCTLCHEHRTLSKSHVIPEFMYKSLYDENHHFHVLTTVKAERNHHLQKGVWEHLLCQGCETQLSTYERYASLVFSGGVQLKSESIENFLLISGIDYPKFKLFQLSVLWRASVAKHKFFKNVNLGRHQEILREMIKSENPGKPTDYGCIMFGLKAGELHLTDLIEEPMHLRFNGHNAYRFTFGGYAWTFIVSNHKIDKLIEPVFLDQNSLHILVKDIREFDALLDFGKRLKTMNRI